MSPALAGRFSTTAPPGKPEWVGFDRKVEGMRGKVSGEGAVGCQTLARGKCMIPRALTFLAQRRVARPWGEAEKEEWGMNSRESEPDGLESASAVGLRLPSGL